MRVGLISAEFPPERGGVQTYAWEYASELARRGHEVTVFTQPHGEGERTPGNFRIEPILRLRRRLDRPLLSKFPNDVWHALNAAYSWIALETTPVFVTVHGNDFLWPYQPVARLDLRPRLHLPCGSNADRWLGDLLTRALVRRSLPHVQHVFTNSRYTEERFCRENPACRGKSSAAMVGVSEAYFAKARSLRREGPPRLLTVCRLAERHKNVDIVLRALSRIVSKWPFTYTVVGDGELLAPLRALADELGLSSRVTFTGFVVQERLQDLLLDSDLFVLTTSATPVAYEGFGLVYIEANACGCPVLAARIGGAAEAVDDGISGLLVDEVTVESVERALTRFLSGSVRFDSDRCVQFARKFSWSNVVDHCLDYYGRPGRERA
ncbi:MAG: glycosyltransferase family 4 protein [Chthoniobacteraceae bacterium]